MQNPIHLAAWKALGANPTPMPFSEVFTAMQQKTIDGQENPIPTIYLQKFYEVQPFITESNHGLLDYLVVTSTEFWEGLPEDIRADVKKCLDEAIAFGNKVALDKDLEDKQKIVDSKMSEVVTITPEQRAKWVEAMKPVWAKFEDKIGKGNIDAAIKANE